MEFKLDSALEPLERTPGVLRAMLSGLSEPWVKNNYGPETFSPFDVVGHLIHGERTDWMPRARHIMERGDCVPFEPFDRYAMYEASREKTIGTLLDEFAALPAESLRALRAMRLTEADLDRKGLHPAMGPVTMRELVAAWVVHDLHHIAQVCKCMAIQYREACGVWREYIGIVNR